MPSAADCSAAPLAPLSGTVLRIVDRQGESGTADLVESLREQAPLEQLIEGIKPPIPTDLLLLTPYAFSSPPFDVQDWTLEITSEGVTAVCFGGALR